MHTTQDAINQANNMSRTCGTSTALIHVAEHKAHCFKAMSMAKVKHLKVHMGTLTDYWADVELSLMGETPNNPKG